MRESDPLKKNGVIGAIRKKKVEIRLPHSLRWPDTDDEPKALIELHSYFVLVTTCNVAALTFMQLFMKTCFVAVFFGKKKACTYLVLRYCRCLYCVKSYVLSSVLHLATLTNRGCLRDNV